MCGKLLFLSFVRMFYARRVSVLIVRNKYPWMAGHCVHSVHSARAGKGQTYMGRAKPRSRKWHACVQKRTISCPVDHGSCFWIRLKTDNIPVSKIITLLYMSSINASSSRLSDFVCSYMHFGSLCGSICLALKTRTN